MRIGDAMWFASRILIAVLLLAVGVGAGFMWGQRRASSDRPDRGVTGREAEKVTRGAGGPMSAMPGMPKRDGAEPAKTEEAIEITLTPDVIERAGIKVAEVRSQAAGTVITVPGTVTPDAYRDTKVNALVGGIVRQVMAELGAEVQRGQPLAVIFSSELADAQMKYLSMQAMFHADHQKLERTRRLADLGAASRQELEEVAATHASHETEVAAARQRLLLLGLSSERVAGLDSASHVVSEVTVAAPASGLVVTRAINPGQVVGASQELFTVTDLTSIWIIGDLYEKDFAAVRVGTGATIVIPSSTAPLRGRVAYIDPRVDPATRTAKVRVEVANRNRELRLGMFVTVNFDTSGGRRVTMAPRAAVQSIGERAVVYVPFGGEEAKFTERTVKVGEPSGDMIQVLEGLKPGEKVVTGGSFLLRAEAGRMRGRS